MYNYIFMYNIYMFIAFHKLILEHFANVYILGKNYNTTISDTKHFFNNRAIDGSRQMFPSLVELKVS